MTIRCKYCHICGSLRRNNILPLLSSFGFLWCIPFIFWMLLWMSGCSSTISNTNAPDETEDNLNRFNTAVRIIFLHIDANLEPEKPVYFVESSDRTTAQRFMENAFQEYISVKDRKIFLVAEDYLQKILMDRQSGYIVSLQVQNMKVEYTVHESEKKKSNKKLFRNIAVQVSCKVINRLDGTVVLARTFSESLQDNISADVINYIQNPALAFTIAEPPKQNRLRDLFELGTVLTAAGTIIYLLFSTRS